MKAIKSTYGCRPPSSEAWLFHPTSREVQYGICVRGQLILDLEDQVRDKPGGSILFPITRVVQSRCRRQEPNEPRQLLHWKPPAGPRTAFFTEARANRVVTRTAEQGPFLAPCFRNSISLSSCSIIRGIRILVPPKFLPACADAQTFARSSPAPGLSTWPRRRFRRPRRPSASWRP